MKQIKASDEVKSGREGLDEAAKNIFGKKKWLYIIN